MGDLDFGTKPNGFRVIALGRDWTRFSGPADAKKNAGPSQVHGLIQYTLDGEDIEDGIRGFTMGPGPLVPLAADLQDIPIEDSEETRKESVNEARTRLFPVLHEQAADATSTVFDWLKPRLDRALVKGLW